MRCSIAAILLVAAGGSCRSTFAVDGVTVEDIKSVPQGWKDLGAPSADKRLQFRIGLHSPNHNLFEQTLLDISTPSHPRYGKHLKRHELKDLIKPRAESTDAVLLWLKDAGIPSRDVVNDGEWINFVAPVSAAEDMMKTKFRVYQSLLRKDVKKIRAIRYSVPQGVRDHIDLIQPTTRFGQIRPQTSHIIDQHEVPAIGATAAQSAIAASCNTTITPACLTDLYNLDAYKAGNASVTIGVNGFLEEYARYSDFAQWAPLYAPNAVGSNFTFTSVNGGLLNQSSMSDSSEANLDIQYTLGLTAPSIETKFFSTPGRGELIPDLDQPSADDNNDEPYLDFFTYLVGLPDGELPQVLSTSYGEDEQSVPVEYNKKVCDLIGQLGTRGVSVIFSSGDTGVGAACQTNDGKNTTRFLPIFPAACPYVTSVGGTRNVEPEFAVSFSSGGFSDVYPRPSYQDTLVPAYLQKLGSKFAGLYNATGRGFPDVAAQGRSFRVVDKGAQISVSGTSASAPTFASVVALLNNARLSAGQPALGFLNPWLYSQGFQGLNDIVNGGSTGCTGVDQYSGLRTPIVPGASWNATSGWDPVTGLGTPDLAKLLPLALSGAYKGRRGLVRGY